MDPPSTKYLQAIFAPITLDETSQSLNHPTHACSHYLSLSLASARAHRDGRHMHGAVEPESTQRFSMRAQPLNHPHLDCSQPPSAVTVVIRFNRAEMFAAKYLWWRTPLVLFRDHLIPTHSVRRTPCWLARARRGVLCAARDRSYSWDDLIHAQN